MVVVAEASRDLLAIVSVYDRGKEGGTWEFGWVYYRPSQEWATHFARGHARRLCFGYETFDVSLPAAREYLGVIQARAIFTEQLEGNHFRFRELKRVNLNLWQRKEWESAPYPIDAEQIFLRAYNLLDFPPESAVVLYSRGFDTSLVPE